MDASQLDDLKQFITTTVSQVTADVPTDNLPDHGLRITNVERRVA